VADQDGDELPTREEIFLRAMSIVEGIEDQCDLLFETFRSNWRPAEAELGDYASQAIDTSHRVLYVLVRKLNRMNRHLHCAYESLPEYQPPET